MSSMLVRYCNHYNMAHMGQRLQCSMPRPEYLLIYRKNEIDFPILVDTLDQLYSLFNKPPRTS